MARVNYVGLTKPREQFEALRPYRSRLIEMSTKYRPYSPEHKAFLEATAALDRLAAMILNDDTFYALGLQGGVSTWKPPQA